MPAAARPEPVPLRFEPIPGVELAGESAGDGPPIVLLHGLTATRRNVVQGSRHLSSRGFRLVGYDARGHGESGPAPDPDAYEYSDLADDLAAVLDELGLERPALAGSSMGAATALRFALRHPERVQALALITPPALGERARPAVARGEPGYDDSELAHWDRLADALDAGDLDAFVEESGANALPERWREPARLATRQRLERHRDLAAVANAVRVVSRSPAVTDPGALATLDVPILVVGSRDEPDPGHPLTAAEALTDLLPRAELIVEEPGDTPLAWQGARLSRAIGDFLERTAR
ncbi:MAG TPA: alpha/beta hydrolase [Thermoleophilaceae bacterium]|nr:alpha/beta hydrolase [Thermoleophilaceae bacterium]